MNSILPRVVIIALIVLCMMNGFAVAALGDASGTVPVHLTEAIDTAIKNRPELSLELEREAIARSKVREAGGNFLPSLDIYASSYYLRNFDTFTGINISAQIAGQNVSVNILKDVPSYKFDAEASLLYNLYAGGKDTALLAEARDNLDAVRHESDTALRKVRFDVSNAYWGLQKAQIEHAIAQRVFDIVRLEVKVAESERRFGRISDVDYAAVLLKSREKEIALRIAGRESRKNYGIYRHVLGLPGEIEETTVEPIPELVDEPHEPGENSAEKEAHPEIMRLKSEIRAASQREKAAYSENHLKIDLFAKYALVGRDSGSYFDSWRDIGNDYYMLGLKVSANLFNGYKTTEQIRQAGMESRVRGLQLALKERELEEKQRACKTALERAHDGLTLAIEREKLQETREKVARVQLKSGRISELEYRQQSADAEEASDRVKLARIEVVLAVNALRLLVLE